MNDSLIERCEYSMTYVVANDEHQQLMADVIEALKPVEDGEESGVHSCSPYCERPACTRRRETELQAQVEELQAEVEKEQKVGDDLDDIIDGLQAKIDVLTEALNEICKLTAPGGFPSYKHLHTITLKAMDDITALKQEGE